MAFLWTTRVVLLSLVLLFALINLGISAGFIAKLHNFDGLVSISTPAYASFGVAVSVLTLISLGPMCVSSSRLCKW